MTLIQDSLTIRDALVSDAKQLCKWWSDGEIMKHSGFPDGLEIDLEEICSRLINATDRLRICMIEFEGKPIGEMNYKRIRVADEGIDSDDTRTDVAQIGIKICDFSMQNQGLGTRLLSMLIDALFRYYGFSKIVLDTNLKNIRAQHVYRKLGFEITKINEDSWVNQLGEKQSSIDYELPKENWAYSEKYLYIRHETPQDYFEVERLTRTAFWRDDSLCDEHFLVHKLRKTYAFVRELDFVAILDEEIIGHIIYSVSQIEGSDGNLTEVLTFGPLSVLPKFQNKGYGKALLRHSLHIAKDLSYRAVIIFGHPNYYPQFGFKRASEFGITTAEGKNSDAFMALPLYEGALTGLNGRFLLDSVYENLNPAEVLEFDGKF
ncbi:MAG: GNAT family N-acetyltransferase [Turicibacter sp.]|nr:GNAT family N-acetyltransferase [Turicibacter sp.]